MKGGLFLLVGAACALALASPAAADGWLPHAPDAAWTYEWTDSVYNPTPTRERVTVGEATGRSFTLRWTTEAQGNPPGTPRSVGSASYQETNGGLTNTDWSSNPPPSSFPTLCSRSAFCNNSLASTQYLLFWGSRSPVLPEPLLSSARWSGTGGPSAT